MTTHVYAAPGTYTARLTVTDGAGSSLAQVFTGQTVSLQGSPQASTTSTVRVPPAPNPSPAPNASPTPAAVGPKLTRIAQSHTTWREGNRLATFARRTRKRPPVGTTFSFVLNESARVALAFSQQAAGRNVQGSCVGQTARTAGNPRAGGRWHAAPWRSAHTPVSTPLASKAAFLPHRSSSPVATHCQSAPPTPPADARARVGLASRSSRRRAHEARAAAGANPREALYALDNRRPTAQQSLIARNVRVLHWRDARSAVDSVTAFVVRPRRGTRAHRRRSARVCRMDRTERARACSVPKVRLALLAQTGRPALTACRACPCPFSAHATWRTTRLRDRRDRTGQVDWRAAPATPTR